MEGPHQSKRLASDIIGKPSHPSQVLLCHVKPTLELETIHANRPTHGEALHDDAHDRRVGRQTVLWLSPLWQSWTATTSNSSTNPPPMYTQTVPEVQRTRSTYAAALLPRQSIIVTIANHGRRRKSRQLSRYSNRQSWPNKSKANTVVAATENAMKMRAIGRELLFKARWQ